MTIRLGQMEILIKHDPRDPAPPAPSWHLLSSCIPSAGLLGVPSSSKQGGCHPWAAAHPPVLWLTPTPLLTLPSASSGERGLRKSRKEEQEWGRKSSITTWDSSL